METSDNRMIATETVIVMLPADVLANRQQEPGSMRVVELIHHQPQQQDGGHIACGGDRCQLEPASTAVVQINPV
jgi:hypothetical protein